MTNMIFWKSILISTILVFFYSFSSAQVVLYMEVMTEEKPIKYFEGQTLSYVSKDYDEWRTIKIERIIDETKLIIYDGGMIPVDDIIKVRRTRNWVKPLSYSLQTFGTVWLVYGGIGALAGNINFDTRTLIIGLGTIASGWLIKKAFIYKKYIIGKKVRLKILDISWPDPTGN